jgi:hypothetical protein
MKPSATVPRSRLPWGTLIVGCLLGVAALALVRIGPFQGTLAERYVSHPVEAVEVILFGCALAAFAVKLVRARRERRAIALGVLPAFDGATAPASEAAPLIADLERVPTRLRDTFLFRRVHAVLGFVSSRGSAEGLDDQMRSLSDADAMALDASYSLTRFITWAIPILGFLGTVLGITEAIAGVTPEVLEQSLSSVTDGLALAFDSTALGLALTMAAMFLNFLVERSEWSALEAVDHHVESELAHRFVRNDQASDSVAAITALMEPLIRRQTELWAETIAEVDRRRRDIDKDLEARLAAAMERTLDAHATRLGNLEKQAIESGAGAIERLAVQARAVCESGKEQQLAIAKLVQGVTAHLQALGRLQAGEEQLLRLQESLDRNLRALHAAGTLDQAVHSLTAAIHLMTSRADAHRSREAA